MPLNLKMANCLLPQILKKNCNYPPFNENIKRTFLMTTQASPLLVSSLCFESGCVSPGRWPLPSSQWPGHLSAALTGNLPFPSQPGLHLQREEASGSLWVLEMGMAGWEPQGYTLTDLSPGPPIVPTILFLCNPCQNLKEKNS